MQFVFALLLIILCSAASELSFPDYIKSCSKKDPDLNNCLKDTLQKMQPYQEEGLPAPDGRLLGEKLEPLKVPKLVINQGSGPVVINSLLNDLDVRGISNATIKSVKFDMDNWMFSITFGYPDFHVVGNYEVDGKILLLPITGRGDGSAIASGITVFTKTFGHLEERDGRTYMKVDRTEYNFDVDTFTIKLNNLFNGNKLLGDTMNRFINENHEEIIDALRQSSSEEFNKVWKGMISRIMNNIPIDVFLSD